MSLAEEVDCRVSMKWMKKEVDITSLIKKWIVKGKWMKREVYRDKGVVRSEKNWYH